MSKYITMFYIRLAYIKPTARHASCAFPAANFSILQLSVHEVLPLLWFLKPNQLFVVKIKIRIQPKRPSIVVWLTRDAAYRRP